MKAYQLLDSEDKWTKQVVARNASNNACDPTDEKAIRWCALGAILRCYNGTSAYEAENKLYEVITRHQSIGEWNDTNNYETVVETLKEIGI
jgi:hypothetical protein